MKNILKVSLFLTILAVTGCAVKTGHQFLEEMSETQISQFLIPNQTTKAQVKEKFGDPEDVDFNPDGTETWVYKFKRSEAQGINYVPVASLFYNGTNDTTKRLKIVYDCQNRVNKYAFSQSQGETRLGAFQ